MQAYALKPQPSGGVRIFEGPAPRPEVPGEIGNPILDQLVAQLADLVAERVAAQLVSPRGVAEDERLDTRRAAEYLGIHRDNVRRLAAEGTIPAEQESAGCKLYFRRSDLDAWRCPGSGSVVPLRGGCNG
jgi:excisionase family DNA binding protein